MTASPSHLPLPELLAPAGTREALDAAIHAGADAVYFGGSRFNARMSADNFDDTAMEDAIRTCAFWGVKSNITLNTLPTERELPDVLRYAEKLVRWGADAIICADLGTAALIHRYFPAVSLHASTQCVGHSTDAAHFFAAHGFSRMVAARELSYADLTTLCRQSPIEVELFIHGALCVSQSGGCLFSALVGRRSGNRGACAQPCRLPYAVLPGGSPQQKRRGGDEAEDYPLSLRDNCLAAHIPALLSLGAASFKIEGRMKSPAYVAGVVRIYRRLLDERRAATAEELDALASLFSRGSGFTDGYFRGVTGRPMRGIRTEADKTATAKAEKQVLFGRPETKKIPVTMQLVCTAEQPMTLTVSARGTAVTAAGAAPMPAQNRAAAADDLKKNLSKLGATPFSAEDAAIAVTLDDGLMVPLSALNAMRRDAAEQLEAALRTRPLGAEYDASALYESLAAPRTGFSGAYAYARQASFQFADRIPDAARTAYDVRYLPLEKFSADPDAAQNAGVNGIILPPVIFDSERGAVCAMLQRAKDAGIAHALVCNVGHIALAGEYGFHLHGDLRLNLWTGQSADVLSDTGLCDVLLSPELTLPQMRDIRTALPHGIVTYGRLPMMTLQRCIIREHTGAAPLVRDCDNTCRYCDTRPITLLRDRTQTAFPVTRVFAHRNIIWNAAPVYMADRQAQIAGAHPDFCHHMFSVETREEADAVIRAYRDPAFSGLPYPGFPSFRRL